jgi:hypothetical protein
LLPATLPWLGETAIAELRSLPESGAAALAVGFSSTEWGGLPLPLSLGALGAPDCALLVSADALLPLAIVQGRARARLVVPAAAGLAGTAFFAQGLVGDPGANALGIVASGALAARVGAR